MELSVEKDNKYLKKHIFAIHSSNNITVLQRKIYNTLLFNASYLLSDAKLYSIHLKDLSDLIGYNSNDYKNLKKSIKDLTQIIIEWNVINENSTNEVIENTSAYLAGVSFNKTICTYEYSEILKTMLITPALYGKVSIQIQAKFKTSSGLALYENCIRYRALKATPWFTIDVLGKLLGFNSSELKYKRIKERYINKALNEVNLHSDIEVALLEEKSGKTVKKVKFILNEKKNTLANLIQSSFKSEELNVIETLKRYSFSDKDAIEIIKNYSIDQVTKAIEYVTNQKSFKEGRVQNIAGYIIKALKIEYKANISSKHLIENERKLKQEEEQKEKTKVEYHNSKYDEYLSSITQTIKAQLNNEELSLAVDEFKAYFMNKSPLFVKWVNDYDDGQFKNKIADKAFCEYLRKNNKQTDLVILSKEEFIKQNFLLTKTAD